ncbi:hypothetical protein GCM10010145_68680 [Streptomyces ruber]|uniref:Uncharacterized protein n=2 Tax=Streptomyces TaxID=1883 RepID=A0A918BSD2_9ACTN|nr:hypothetical protein [Streptomyces ruber]GGQ89466.1 hypothetical protein GCM10010145_68680 [Streptomyces ruber]
MLADEPADPDGGIPLRFTELQLCSPEPLPLVVLLHWRACEQDGGPRSAESVWSTLTEQGICSYDGETPVSLGEVRQAVDFLLAEGVVTAAAGGDL